MAPAIAASMPDHTLRRPIAILGNLECRARDIRWRLWQNAPSVRICYALYALLRTAGVRSDGWSEARKFSSAGASRWLT